MKGFPVTARLAPVSLALSLLVFGCSNSRTPQTSEVQPAPAPAVTRTVRIPVEGMSCASCVASVKTALSKLDGVFKVEVDLAERVARVQFVPEKVTPDLLVATIKGAGFDAGPAAHVN